MHILGYQSRLMTGVMVVRDPGEDTVLGSDTSNA